MDDAGFLQPADRLTALGRDAIYWAYRGMGFPRGTTAWMPAFHCGVEVEAVLDAGFSVAYYGVGPDLAVNEGDLRDGLRALPGPVLLIHYFGFAQPQTRRVLELCTEHRVPLVEDCCHGLFSLRGDEALGSVGHLATFSVRKTMGTVDGGVLRVDTRRYSELTGLRFQPPPNGERAAWPYRALARRTLQAHVGALPTALDRWLCTGVPDADLRTNSGLVPPAREVGGARSSRLSERVLRTARPNEIVKLRRANWERLHSALRDLAGFQPQHAELPPGTCPLAYVLCTSQRAAMVDALNAGGVEPYVFGANAHATLPVARFPTAEPLRQQLLCLPVHQGLRPMQMERMVTLLGRMTKAREAAGR